jgi:glycosyltransferase involved in cell wall biosynthesis
MPKVSVIIPAYNYADYTVNAVESVLAQTFHDYEIIVVNDGSTDETEKKLRRFIADRRIIYIYQENHGVAHARNTGIKNSFGEYVAFLDCDDLYMPDKLERSVQALDKNQSLSFIYTPVLFVSESGRTLGRDREKCYSGKVFDRLILNNFIRNSTAVIRRHCFDKIGLFDEALFYTADWEMWLRVSSIFGVGYIGAPLSKYRQREYDYFVKNPAKVKEEMLKVKDKIFDNNPYLSRYLKQNLSAQILVWTIKSYLVKKDLLNAKRELSELLKCQPFNIKLQALKFVISNGLVFNSICSIKEYLRRIKWN